MRPERNKPFGPILIFFIIMNALAVVFGKRLEAKGVDHDVVIAGNVLLFLVTILSLQLAKRGLSNPNTQAFIRSIYSSMMLKMFACIIAAFVYVWAAGQALNKPALFICMGLYLVYTFMEVSVLTRMLKKKPNV